MVSGYGLAEATQAVTMHPPGQPPAIDRNGYVASGKPLKGKDIKIDFLNRHQNDLHPGEILVKSDALMKGYFNDHDLVQSFDEEGYLRTGDIGYTDMEGNLFILGRKRISLSRAA